MRNCRRCIRLYFCHRFCFIRKQLYTRYKSNQIPVNCVYTTLFSSHGTTHRLQNRGLLLTVTGSTESIYLVLFFLCYKLFKYSRFRYSPEKFDVFFILSYLYVLRNIRKYLEYPYITLNKQNELSHKIAQILIHHLSLSTLINVSH